MGRQLHDAFEDRREVALTKMTQPLWLFGTKIESSVGGEGEGQEGRRFGEDTLALTLAIRVNGADTMVGGDSPKSINSNPFNLGPFIFGMGVVQGDSSRGRASTTSKMRRLKSRYVCLPELGKRGHRERDERGLILGAKKCALYTSLRFTVAEANVILRF
ncbi:hypothetical protein C1H46_020092 [Malus baccata]|uniref:Uncharacterized protein n=1 Tax=Malus baccata TaxID=106549 RepID=A0A540M6G5_MALBA|nr:hypothetical protein C1H46_020092 [Malus baccata]